MIDLNFLDTRPPTISRCDAGSILTPDSAPEVECIWEIYAGDKWIAELQADLSELAARCGQGPVVNHIEYFLSNPYPSSRRPLGIFRDLGLRSEAFVQRSKRPVIAVQRGGRELTAAVLLHEYRIFGVPTRLYVSADQDGWRTVIAPGSCRLAVAKSCSEFLISKGATLISVSFIEEEGSRDEAPFIDSGKAPTSVEIRSGILLASRRREIKQRLRLMSDYDGTLATLGTRTRRNLRAATRRVKSELACEYDAEAQINEQEFIQAYRNSTHPMPNWVAQWRYASNRATPGAFLAGMRNSAGVWLAVLGGRRSNDTTFVDWQINAKYNGPLSLGTALRAFFIEDEHGRGTSLIHFEGGTSHTMSHAFLEDGARDLLFGRPNLSPRLLRLLALLFPATGLLTQAILGPNVEWTQGASERSKG